MPARWDDIAESLRRRTRRLVSARGLSWLALTIVLLLWTIGLADWLLRFDASWVRLLLALGVLGAVAVVVRRTLWRPLTTRLTDVDVARTIERTFPRWGDRLSSAAQFREERFDARLGSPDLQQRITAEVDQRLADVDVERVLDPRPTKQLVVTAAVVCLVGLTAALWQRSAAATVLTRLALPFANVEWPRTTDLRFLDADLKPLDDRPQRTAAGEAFILYLENTLGNLPDDVQFELRLPDGEREQRTLQTTVLRDDAGGSHEVGIATLTAHSGPLEFRATGGDDAGMRWRTLNVVPLPALASVTITITPPTYTGQPARVLDGAGAVEALVGSRIQMVGKANTPLAKADLRREGQPPQGMTLSAKGREFAVEFMVEEAGPSWYWFDVADHEGLSPGNPPRYQLRGVADRQPTVFIDQPAGDVTVTADAEVPLRIIARDDLGVAELRIVFSRPDAAPAVWSLPLSTERPTDETVEIVWNLASLGLSAGDRLTYHAEAVDACNLPLEAGPSAPASADGEHTESEVRPIVAAAGQVGLSAHRHIEILSREDKRRELAARQLGILDTLQVAQDRQSLALESTAGLRIQSELAEQLPADDLDLLKQTELEQQTIRDRLSGDPSGAAHDVERLREELEQNQIDDPQMAARLEQLAADLDTLRDELLPTIEQALARARKQLQSSGSEQSDAPVESTADTQQQLRMAEHAQTAALAVLNDATSQLGSWRQQYEVTSELDDLVASQSDVHQQTQDVGRETLTKRLDALTPQEQADLARLSDRQRRLATRLDELLHRRPPESADGNQTSPARAAVSEALHRLAQRDTLSQMHQAAESLKRNDIAGTAAAQEQVLNDLRDFGELLQTGNEEAAESLLSTIEERAEAVETLRKRQQELVTRTQQLLGPTADSDRPQQLERLTRQQEQLADQADDLARSLRREQRRQSAQSAARASRRMREAQQAIEQRQPEQTGERQQEALDDLNQLAGELAQQQQELEREWARQQIEQLSDDVQGLADDQEVVTAKTVDLDQRQRERGSWSRSLRKELHDVRDAQTGLADRLDEMRQAMTDYPVIDLSLQRAAEPMREAADRLDKSEAGASTVERQRTAHQRLLAIVEVTRQSLDQQPQSADNNGPQQPPQKPQGQQDSQIPQLLATQLRLLRQLQADVQQRTAALRAQLKDDDTPDDELMRERTALASDQGHIAEMTRTLLEQFAEHSMNQGNREPMPEPQP